MKIKNKFSQLKSKNEKALISYLCAGDPTLDDTKKHIEALIKAGVDIIELGLPFSDPVADGPIIQAASDRALKNGMNPDIYFNFIATLNISIPVVCMTYYNLIFKRGIDKFIKDCASSNIAGLIVPDLPIEEANELLKSCDRYDIDLIFMITPLTDIARMDLILSKCTGFVYIISRLGVTGINNTFSSDTKQIFEKINTNLPKAVGFGISNKAQAREMLQAGADAVIIGSAFVNIIASNKDVLINLENLARDIKKVCIY